MGQFARCYISPKEQGHPDASIVETFQETSPNPRTSPRVFVAVPALLQPYRSYAPTDFLFARYSEHRCHFVVVLIATQRLGLATFRNGLGLGQAVVRISAQPARLFVVRCTAACRPPSYPSLSSVWIRSVCNRRKAREQPTARRFSLFTYVWRVSIY
jgi:hypothetical protein